MDVGLGLVDVADLHVLARGWHDLHDPDRPDGTPGLLTELRLLIALRHQQQVIEVVAVSVLVEERDRLLESLDVLRRCRPPRPLGVFQVPRQDVAALPRLHQAGDEDVQLFLELRAVLADHPAELSAGADCHSGVGGKLGEDLLPEVGEVVLDDGHLDEAGVHHLEDVLVLEILRRQPDFHRRLLRLRELGVERLDALVVARGLAQVDVLPRQVLHG